MLPVIAIVGRPNVGKSTLFNCLTRTRNALTTDIPGTTRDRNYGQVNLDDRKFIIIDTGGLTEDSDAVGKLMDKQVQLAIEEADSIFFVLDGKEGVTATDQNIAKQLRKTGKKIFLVLNKSETHNLSSQNDVLGLGFGTPILVSAAHRRGITELVQTAFPQPNLALEDQALKDGIIFAIVGRPNVGKSTLVNRMLGEERVIVHDAPGTTRDSIFIPFEHHGKFYTLIDTAGVRKRKKIADVPEKFSIVKTLQAIESANVILYVIDARLGVSEQDLKLFGFILECGKALVIAVNKWDDMSTADRTQTKNSIDRQLDFVNFARIHFISALHGSNVGNLFASINEAYVCANKKISTPMVTRLLQAAVAAHTPPLVRGRRIKMRYAHMGGHNPPRIIIHGNQLDSLPESYRKFLAHFFQKKLKLHGTPIQIEFKKGENPYVTKQKK